MGVHHGVMYLKHSTCFPCWVNVHVQPLVWLDQGGETGLNIPCYRLHLSAQCCLPVLGLIQVQGGRKTIMHCLPSSFSSLPCSGTGEVCLAVSETVVSSNQPATTMATIISSSVIFFNFFYSFYVSSWTFCPNGTQHTHIVCCCFWDWNWGIIFGPTVIWVRRGKQLKRQTDGHLLAYFNYLFLRWPRSAWWDW